MKDFSDFELAALVVRLQTEVQGRDWRSTDTSGTKELLQDSLDAIVELSRRLQAAKGEW